VREKYALPPPGAIARHWSAALDESPKPNDRRLKKSEYVLIARPLGSLQSAAAVARAAGVTPLILGDAIEGEAREVGRAMAGIAHSVAAHGHPIKAPAVLLSGGETTVTGRGHRRGGRHPQLPARR